MAELDPEIVEELYGTPFDEFVARRDARAKELRSGGDRAAADGVKKLRKPSVSAAAVNRLARDATDSVSSLLAAGEALRQAQLGGGDRDAIRSAASEEREAVDRLVAEAGAYGLSPAALDEVRSTLHAAALDDSVREDVRRGVLVEPRQAMGLGGLGATVSRPRAGRAPAPEAEPAASPGPKRRRKAATKCGDEGDRKNAAAEAKQAAEAERKAAAAERAAEAERKRAAKERVRAAKAALREAEKAAKAAERERDQAARALEKAERAAEAAREEADRAGAELEAAESA
jgi:hypothetical protein